MASSTCMVKQQNLPHLTLHLKQVKHWLNWSSTIQLKKRSGGYYWSGGFWFKTNKGRTFKASSKKSPGNSYVANIGSGPLCGVFSRGGADIDCLGFAMLWPVKSAVSINVKYPGLETMPVASTPTEVNRVGYDNSSIYRTKLMVSLKGETEVTTKTAWSDTTSLEYGVTTIYSLCRYTWSC